jgi:tetratricopeptide (TPR) repeat protein
LSGSPLFEEWALLEREDLKRKAVQALALLAEYHERRREYTLAHRAAARLVELAPWEENAHVWIMRLLAMHGQWSAALAQYVACRRTLDEQLGLEPSAETTALFADLRVRSQRDEPLPPRYPLPPDNLPLLEIDLVGRTEELDLISARLADPACRLLTLLGPGGVGKTRLALEAARAQVGLYADGVWLVSLGAATSIDELVPAVAAAVEFAFTGPEDPDKQLINYLRRKSLLLVLDNYEQLLPDVDWLMQLLGAAAGVQILVTSQKPLNLQAEYIIELSGLSYPTEAELANAGGLASFSALALFEQVAQRVQPNFDLVAHAQTVTHICRLVDGMPLSIELVASGVRHKDLTTLVDQIQTNLDAFSTEMRDVPTRHRSLRAVFQHAWSLLDRQEQDLFCQLAIFQGSFGVEAAAAVTERPCDSALVGLVSSYLLRRAGSGRFEMHDLVRQYACECLRTKPDEAQHTAIAHGRYFAGFLAERAYHLVDDRQKKALDEIDRDEKNIVYAWRTLCQLKMGEELAACADGLYHYYSTRSLLAMGIELFMRAEQALEDEIHHEFPLAVLQARRGALALRLRQFPVARQALTTSIAVFERLGQTNELGLALMWLGGVVQSDDSLDSAVELEQRALALFHRTGNTWGQALALYRLGLAENQRGQMPAAAAFLKTSLALSRQSGDRRSMIGPLNILGDIAAHAGDYPAAIDYFEECLSLCGYLEDRMNTGLVLGNLGTIYHYLDEYARSSDYYRQSLAISRDLDDRVGIALALNNLGEVEVLLGNLTTAEAEFDEALAIGREIDDDWVVAVSLMNRGRVALKQDELTCAQDCLKAALKLAAMNELWDELVKLLILLGELHMRQGKATFATELILTAKMHPACEEGLQPKIAELLGRLPAGVSPRPLEVLLAELLI